MWNAECGLWNKGKKQRGVSLIAAIFIIVILAFMGLMFVSMVNTASFTSANDLQSTQALHVAEGGLAYGIEQLNGNPLYAGDINKTLGRGTFTTTVVNSLTTVNPNPIAIGDLAINVTSTAGFSIPGTIKIDSEYVYCTGKTATAFTGCTRGYQGTTVAVSHLVNSNVSQYTLSSTGKVGSAQRVVKANLAAAPAFQAVGTLRGGTGAVSPPWPAHAINDIALLVVESCGGQPVTLTTPAGFVAVANSPQFTIPGGFTTGTRITVYWARATSTAMATPTVGDPGNHVDAQIITYRGVINTGTPWNITGGGVKTPASFTVTVTGVITTVPITLIVQAVTRDNDSAATSFSAETNANLTSLTERSDIGTTQGNGGGFVVCDGVKATAGATGNTTANISASVYNAFLTIALPPPPTARILDWLEVYI